MASIPGIVALAQDAGAPVYFEGREILRIYGSFGPYSAKDRAGDITARLRNIAESGDTRQVIVTFIPAQNATAIATSRSLILMVTEGDAKLAGKPQARVAEEYARAVRAALLTYRERRTVLSYLSSSGKALAAWVIFAAFI